MQEVLKANPGMQVERWNLVAQRLNELFHAEGHWRTASCLFDGHMCHFLFRRLVVHPAKHPLEIRNKHLAMGAREGEVLVPGSPGSEPKEEAHRCYEGGTREQWDTKAKISKCEGFDKIHGKLPREIFGSKVV